MVPKLSLSSFRRTCDTRLSSDAARASSLLSSAAPRFRLTPLGVGAADDAGKPDGDMHVSLGARDSARDGGRDGGPDGGLTRGAEGGCGDDHDGTELLVDGDSGGAGTSATSGGCETLLLSDSSMFDCVLK